MRAQGAVGSSQRKGLHVGLLRGYGDLVLGDGAKGLAGWGWQASVRKPPSLGQDASLTVLFTSPPWNSSSAAELGRGGERNVKAATASLEASSPTFLGQPQASGGQFPLLSSPWPTPLAQPRPRAQFGRCWWGVELEESGGVLGVGDRLGCEDRDGGSGGRPGTQGERMEGVGQGCRGRCLEGRWWRPRPNP